MSGPEKDPKRGQPPEREAQQRRDAARRPEDRPEDLDPREEDGWSQPESSAQKGAERDEG